jgi:hypothetical protein
MELPAGNLDGLISEEARRGGRWSAAVEEEEERT